MQCLLWNYRRDYRMLSDNDIQTFNRDGAIVLRNQLSSAWLQRIEEAIERDIAKPAPFFHGYVATGGSGRFHGNLRIWDLTFIDMKGMRSILIMWMPTYYPT